MRLKVKDVVFEVDEVIAYGKIEVSMASPGVEGVTSPMVITNPGILLYLRGGGQPMVIRFSSIKERDAFFKKMEEMLPFDTEFIVNKH